MTQADLKQKANVITNLMQAIGDCIKGHKNGVPSGVLYSQLLPFGINLQQYDGIIDAFVSCKVVIKKGNLLFWNQA